MKIKTGFELKSICGENIIISHGVENINFTKVITLNESAAYLWKKLLDKEFSTADMVTELMSEYEVDEATAKQDAEALVASWKDAGLLD